LTTRRLEIIFADRRHRAGTIVPERAKAQQPERNMLKSGAFKALKYGTRTRERGDQTDCSQHNRRKSEKEREPDQVGVDRLYGHGAAVAAQSRRQNQIDRLQTFATDTAQ